MVFERTTNDRFYFLVISTPSPRGRDLFNWRDLATLIFNSPRSLVEMTALFEFTVISSLCPNILDELSQARFISLPPFQSLRELIWKKNFPVRGSF